jgi:uncharacterized protein
MSRVVHFEIHADEPERAIRFYRSVFEWEFVPFPGNGEYWFIRTGDSSWQPGIDGGLVRRKEPLGDSTPNAFVCTVSVDDVDRYLMRVKASGGKLAGRKRAVGGIGWLAYATDTEGNVFGLMQPDEDAA